MTDRDTVRDQIESALRRGGVFTHNQVANVMAIVGPIARSRDAYRDERDATQRELNQVRRDSKIGWENCHQTEDHLAELYEAAGIAPETLIEDAVDALSQLRWLHAEAVWQRDETRAKLQHAQTYADNCAKHAAVEVLRGDVAWHLRQIVTQPPRNCADASCVYNGPDEPGPDARVWARGAPQPDGVTHVRERGERHWGLNRTDNLWYLRDVAEPMLSWDELLGRCGWVVEVPPVGQP